MVWAEGLFRLPVSNKVPEPPTSLLGARQDAVPNKTMVIGPAAERMRFVLDLPAIKRIMSISFRKTRAHGSGVG